MRGIEKRHFYRGACVPDFAHELDELPNGRERNGGEGGEGGHGTGEEEGGRESVGLRREENRGREGEEGGREGGRQEKMHVRHMSSLV